MDAKQRAAEADFILTNPAYHEAMQAVRAAITRSMFECDVKDDDGRRHYKRLMDCSLMFENALRGFVQTGQIEESKLKNKKRWLG